MSLFTSIPGMGVPAPKSKPRSTANKKSTPIKPFPFLTLPRELRDRIYTAALVSGIIDIDLVTCASDDDDSAYADRYPDPKLRTWFISLGKKMTYRLVKSSKCSCGTCSRECDPNLNLFKTNRQIYQEAREIFYAQNSFNTLLASGLGFSTFLKDRPHALHFIRSLDFDINTHVADWSYSRFGNKVYTELFKQLKQQCNLRSLKLNIHGLVPDVTEEHWMCRCELGALDHPLLAIGEIFNFPGSPAMKGKKAHENEWAMFRALSDINDLTRLRLNVDFCHHMIDHLGHDEGIFEHDHIRDFINWMRSRMLKNGSKLGKDSIHGYCHRGEMEEQRYRFHSDDDQYGKSYLKPFMVQHQTVHIHDDSGSEPDSEMPDDVFGYGNGGEDSEGFDDIDVVVDDDDDDDDVTEDEDDDIWAGPISVDYEDSDTDEEMPPLEMYQNQFDTGSAIPMGFPIGHMPDIPDVD